jgi:hypothetical protein
MSFEKLIDERIERAIADGEFDNLPGKGKPLDLDWYFDLPEDLRLSYSILKNAGCAPEEAQLMKQLESLRSRLDSSVDDDESRKLRKSIAEKELYLKLLLERRKRS